MTESSPQAVVLPKGAIVGGSLSGSQPGWATASTPTQWAKLDDHPDLQIGYDGTEAPEGSTPVTGSPTKWAKEPLGPNGEGVTMGSSGGSDPSPTGWIQRTS
ncbi:MAG: hypothetical protein AAF196_03380 [Planctomycetota bacterium]